MEAMAMEIPVAAYEIPGIDQLITHNQTGLLASYGDKEKLSSYWERLLNDTDYAKLLAANSRQYVLENFSAKRMADQYCDIFYNLATKSSS
jgi:glycosyltransferase involved in cell wall biosynthesis